MPRKLTRIRRSLHNAFKRQAKCKDYLKMLPNGSFLYNLVIEDMKDTNMVINELRDQELIWRLDNFINLGDFGPAYPTKGNKKVIA